MVEILITILGAAVGSIVTLAFDRKVKGPRLATQKQVSSIQRRRYEWDMKDVSEPDAFDNRMPYMEASRVLTEMEARWKRRAWEMWDQQGRDFH